MHRQAILLLVVESGTRKFCCLSVECLFVESGTYDVICQFCTVKGMVVESEILKAQSCALSNKACLCTLMYTSAGTQWVMFTYQNFFDSYGCPLPVCITKQIENGLHSEIKIRKMIVFVQRIVCLFYIIPKK